MTRSQVKELATFAEYCTARIDRGVERQSDRWRIRIAPSHTGTSFVAFAMAVACNTVVHARGTGSQPIYALWDALSRLEQPLRELG
jgi:hypothetical protein